MTLLELQRRMAHAIYQPLTGSDHIAERTREGDRMEEDAAECIKPNNRLSSVERLEIYSRSYWFRVLDSLYDDFPGLVAILGSRGFHRMARAYLAECPSRSYTLRNLGSQLREWMERNPAYAGKHVRLTLDMARLEWAHIEAFDGRQKRALGPEDLLDLGPALSIGLQPYVQLLELHYPVDNLRISVNRTEEEHGMASNVARAKKHRTARNTCRLEPEEIFLAVHRVQFEVYYRRLATEEYWMLRDFQAGKPVGAVLERVAEHSSLPVEELTQKIQAWFAMWAELGWLCRPEQDSKEWL